ncbi:hypothetical protein, partial [Ideonella dechloratans]|uniref:hypothetical protein n=1 Tax=Ideonella dechloratans TaxID=36863 RepID=UPI001B87CCE7
VLADPGQFGIGQQEVEQHGQETFRYQEPGADSDLIPNPDHKGAYSTRWRTRFHADGGQCSTMMADSVPR